MLSTHSPRRYHHHFCLSSEKICGDPGLPFNAALDVANSNVGNYEYMSIQRFNCYQGFEVITGSLQIECTQYGNWSNSAPACNSKI